MSHKDALFKRLVPKHIRDLAKAKGAPLPKAFAGPANNANPSGAEGEAPSPSDVSLASITEEGKGE